MTSPTATRAARALRSALPARRPTLRELARELARFSSIGIVAFVVDMGTYNVLRFGPVDAMNDRPLTSRVIAVVLATAVSWVGNRHWTFADQRTGQQGRELVLFTVINLFGIGITVATLAFSHHVLGMAGPFSDNIANVLGILLGTVVRYVGYKLFVFTGAPAPAVAIVASAQLTPAEAVSAGVVAAPPAER